MLPFLRLLMGSSVWLKRGGDGSLSQPAVPSRRRIADTSVAAMPARASLLLFPQCYKQTGSSIQLDSLCMDDNGILVEYGVLLQ